MGVTSLALVAGVAGSAGALSILVSGKAARPRSPARVGGLLADASRRIGRTPLAKRARAFEALSRRREECLSELPALLDVVTLGLSAGLSFDASLELFCDRGTGELARAFSEAMLSWRMGVRGREEALWRLADELDLQAMRRFASVVGESLTFGVPLAGALERQADAIRSEQRAQVEEEIERVPVKMLIPLGTLIVPAMFLAILGPLLGSVVVG